MKNYIVKVLSISAIYEFVVNIFCLPIWLLLLLYPLFFILGGIIAYSEDKKEYEIVNKLANNLFYFICFLIFIYTIYHFIKEYKLVLNKEQLNLFLLPFAYTLAFLLFSFINKIFEEYQMVFKRLSWRKDVIIPVDFKCVIKIYKFCKFDFIKLNKFLFFLTSSEYLKQTTNIENLIEEYKRRTTFVPFDSSIAGFSIGKMKNLFEKYGLLIEDYKYLEYDEGYGNYYGNVIDKINRKSFNSITYSISGTNQAVQHLKISYFKSKFSDDVLSLETDNLYKNLCNLLYSTCFDNKLKKHVLNKNFEYVYTDYKIINEITKNNKNITEYNFIISVINPSHSKYYIN